MSRLLPVLAMTAALALAACAGGADRDRERRAAGTSGQRARVRSRSIGRRRRCRRVPPSTEAGTVEAAMTGKAFSPGTIQAKVGDVIAWTNGDGVPTRRRTRTTRLHDRPTRPGRVGRPTFSAAGTYAFFCKIHRT